LIWRLICNIDIPDTISGQTVAQPHTNLHGGVALSAQVSPGGQLLDPICESIIITAAKGEASCQEQGPGAEWIGSAVFSPQLKQQTKMSTTNQVRGDKRLSNDCLHARVDLHEDVTFSSENIFAELDYF
jgi:hypothetical protein